MAPYGYLGRQANRTKRQHIRAIVLIGVSSRLLLLNGTACVGALIHTTSTIFLVYCMSRISQSVLSEGGYQLLASLLLLALGLYYLSEYIIFKKRGACCNSEPTVTTKNQAADRAAVVSLALLMAFSPCVGSMPVLFGLFRPPLDALRAGASFCTLLCTSALVMTSLVIAGFKGAKTFDIEVLRKHEKLFLGLSFVLLSVVTYFFLSHAHHHHHGVHTVSSKLSTASTLSNSVPSQNHHHHHHHHH